MIYFDTATLTIRRPERPNTAIKAEAKDAIVALVRELRQVHNQSAFYNVAIEYYYPTIHLMWTRWLSGRLKDYFKDQSSLDLAVQRLALHARVTPESLGVSYETRAFVIGRATLRRKNVDGNSLVDISTAEVVHQVTKNDSELIIHAGCRGIILVDRDVHSQKVFLLLTA
jgi:hypothetical protein